MKPYEIGDFVAIQWKDNSIDILRVLREEETEDKYTRVWCEWINKTSTRAQTKADDVFLWCYEFESIEGATTVKVVKDEKEKLEWILKSK